MVKDVLRSRAPSWLSANIVGMGYQVVAGTAALALAEGKYIRNRYHPATAKVPVKDQRLANAAVKESW